MAASYFFHSDAGHGWLGVKRTELERLGIAEQITHYSYQRGGMVYLEEDQDASTFAKRKQELGEEMPIRQGKSVDRSPIRSYESYKVTTGV